MAQGKIIMCVRRLKVFNIYQHRDQKEFLKEILTKIKSVQTVEIPVKM